MAGRGRGRGRPTMGPIARDDEGNPIVMTGPVQPPPLFPLRRRQLMSAFRSSPYYLELPKEDVAADIQRYSDRYTKKSTTSSDRPPLSSVMTLTPNNFPSELYGRGGKGRSKQVLSNVMNVNKASDDLLKLEELAQLERKYADEEGADEAKGKPEGEGKDGKTGEEGEEEDQEEEEAEEDEYDDDYMQGYDFDDDDGYDDNDVGGDDDEAVF